MNNALTVMNGNTALITSEEVEVLKKSMFQGFTDPEIKFALAVANQLRLHPLLRQIHFVKRGGKVVPQTGIDGFRLTAERTGQYAGSDEPVFAYAPTDTAQKQPIKASLTVYKLVGGQRCAFQASARWDEYYPGDAQGQMWRKMPHTMLAKCAESLALRKAFPAELSSVYSDDEMAQAEKEVSQEKAKAVSALVRQPEMEVQAEVEPAPVRPNPTVMVENIRKVVQSQGTVVPEPETQGQQDFLTGSPLGEEDDAGAYVVPFGKDRGKTLRDLGREAVESKMNWINTKADKPLSKNFLEFLAAANHYLASGAEDDVP